MNPNRRGRKGRRKRGGMKGRREETREDDKLSYTLPHLLCMYMLMAVVIITGNMAARAKKFSKESAMKLAHGVAVVLSWQLNFSWKYYQND